MGTCPTNCKTSFRFTHHARAQIDERAGQRPTHRLTNRPHIYAGEAVFSPTQVVYAFMDDVIFSDFIPNGQDCIDKFDRPTGINYKRGDVSNFDCCVHSNLLEFTLAYFMCTTKQVRFPCSIQRPALCRTQQRPLLEVYVRVR